MQMNVFSIDNIIQSDNIKFDTKYEGVMFSFCIGIDESIYNKSSWNVKVYVNQKNNKIFIQNYNRSYNLA